MIILNILAFVFLLGLVIFIHELGHFIVAKRAGILCHEFALGMGPILFSFRKGETLYSLRAVPIGGFVSMAGEELSKELLKPGAEVKVLFDKDPDLHATAAITHIIHALDDARYANARVIDVETVDLQGKDDGKLTLNHYPVKRDAVHVMGKKTMQIAPYDRSFESKSLWNRFLTIFAGPLMNFVLAFVIFVGIAFAFGLPDVESNKIGGVSEQLPAAAVLQPGDEIVSIDGETVESWYDIGRIMAEKKSERTLAFVILRDGDEHTFVLTPIISFYNAGFASKPGDIDDLIIGSVGEGSPAGKAGLLAGDKILDIDGQSMTTWEDIILVMEAHHEGGLVDMTVLREGAAETVTLELFSRRFLEGQNAPFIQAHIGIASDTHRVFFGSFASGARSLFGSVALIFSTLRAIFVESNIGVGDLAGPVGIYAMTTHFVAAGLISFLSWVAILSVNLGIINLLPIPALDGGRIVFLGYEAVFRRPVNRQVENLLHFIVFILLIALMLYVTFNDIMRLGG